MYTDNSWSVCDCFFFFKQKTAYEMRISDWSSDVCSSDLATFRFVVNSEGLLQMYSHLCARLYIHSGEGLAVKFIHPLRHVSHATGQNQIGRASCRERVCQYV